MIGLGYFDFVLEMTPAEALAYKAEWDRLAPNRKDHMTEGNGEQHTHEETVKDEHSTEDGTVKQETTETTEAETNGDEE